MKQGEVSGFNGKMIGNLGITHGKCQVWGGLSLQAQSFD